MKKLLAIVISVAVIIAMLPTMAFAADATEMTVTVTGGGETATITVQAVDTNSVKLTAEVSAEKAAKLYTAETVSATCSGTLANGDVAYTSRNLAYGLWHAVFAGGSVTVAGKKLSFTTDNTSGKYVATATGWSEFKTALKGIMTENSSASAASIGSSSPYTFTAGSAALPGYEFNKQTTVTVNGTTVTITPKSSSGSGSGSSSSSSSSSTSTSTDSGVKTSTDTSSSSSSTTGGTTTSTTVSPAKTETTTNASGEKVTTTTAAVADTTATALAQQAVANKSDTVEVDVTTAQTTTTTATGETKTEVTLPAAAVDTIATDTDAALAVKTDAGEIVLDNTALGAVAAASEAKTIAIAITDNATLTTEQAPAAEVVGETGQVIDLAVTVDNVPVHDFAGGKATVAVPLSSKLKADSIKVVYISDKGLCEAIPHTVVTENGKQMVQFTTTHFSTFAVVDAESADKLIAEQESAVKDLIAGINLTVRTSKTSKKSIKATVSGDISALTDAGYTVQYKFYRSTKKASKYVAKTTAKDKKTYVNTVGKKGTKYYYKAKAYVYNGDTLVGTTALKQCKYGSRTWTK